MRSPSIAWTQRIADVAALSSRIDDPQARASANWFACAATALPAPRAVSLGYWRNSVRFIWADQEAEVFADTIEAYRFDAAQVSIAELPFRPGDPLPADLARHLGLSVP